ncbi:HET-domain-containing protein [Zalerion maritima]|uniref:HET-domain-containing protein n=1 Tax=Zalerion maritima TaxID=339359 RepID=A0AAD5RTY3_9PEZI|nr:HET-domain-containing protein [Zalerion maritima]
MSGAESLDLPEYDFDSDAASFSDGSVTSDHEAKPATPVWAKEKFKYSPLDLNGPSFRLLRLHRGAGRQISCELFQTWLDGLDRRISYEALSYAWGSSDFRKAIEHLRSPDHDRVIWADAICTDQTHEAERGHQVRHMTKIYTQADDDARLKTIWAAHREDGSRELLGLHLQGVKTLLARQWFTRAWILQEVANARASLVCCGSKSIQARFFALAPKLVGVKPEQSTSFLLNKFGRGCDASDPRDKIYALLGLSTDANESNTLVPDYTKTEQQLIRDAIQFFYHFDPSPQTLQSIRTMDDFVLQMGKLDEKSLPLLVANSDFKTLGFLLETEEVTETSRCVAKVILSALLPCISSIHDEFIPDLLPEPILRQLQLAVEEKQVHNHTPKQPRFTGLLECNSLVALFFFLLELGTNIEAGDANNTLAPPTSDGGLPSFSHDASADGLTVEQLGNIFCAAALIGDERFIKFFLEEGVDVEYAWLGQGPLLWAMQGGHENIAARLAYRDALYKVPGQGGKNSPWPGPRVEAIRGVVRVLLDRAADMEISDWAGNAPLAIAIEEAHAEVAKFFSPPFRSEEPSCGNILQILAAKGDDNAARLLRDRKGREASLEEKYEKGHAELSLAASSGYESIMRLLTDGKDIEDIIKEENDKWQEALIQAASNGHGEAVRFLTDGEGIGATINEEHQKWQAVLSQEGWSGYENTGRIFLDRDAEINIPDTVMERILGKAASYGHESIVRFLLDRGTKGDMRNMDGHAALSNAASNGHESIVRLLLDCRAKGNIRDMDVEVACIAAASNGHDNIANLIRERFRV